MNSWQPIETAPKDGTQILLYYPEYHKKVWIGHYYVRETFSHGKLEYKNEGWSNGSSYLTLLKESAPTHWMALPEAPNSNNLTKCMHDPVHGWIL